MTGQEFADWMSNNTNLSSSSVGYYTQELRTTSQKMQSSGVIDKSLLDLNRLQYEVAVMKIFMNPELIKYNTVGKSLYSNSLKNYQTCLKENSDFIYIEKEAEAIIYKSNIPQTEKNTLIKTRIGQGLFKQRLIDKYDGKCVIIQISNKKLLIASHIKPFAVSNNREHLDFVNGLLLSTTYDKLFDLGLISFKDDGCLLVSKILDKDALEKIYLSKTDMFDLKLSKKILINFKYHKDSVFVG